MGEAGSIDGGLTPAKGKTSRGEVHQGLCWGWVRRWRDVAVEVSDKEGHNLSSDLGWAKDVDVITVRHNHPTGANDGLKGKEEGVEAQTEELSPDTAALPRPAA